ncbi:glycoside hydrolase family 43 protein [Microlunatus sp. GCM10028923]|uniref:glycoside hydrolase family 43 protein n=1 Tax=Microlunatus sp. GCM10028923 TaxID=3273400 RepID=UPI0036201F2A
MPRPRRVVLALVAALILVLGPTAPAVAGVPDQPYLALDQDFPDPALLHAEGRSWLYSTNSGAGNLPVATAATPYGAWQVLGDALPVLGAWASPGFTWAPDVTRLGDGRYLVYYTARHTASGRQWVGAAESGDPRGPFTPLGDGPLYCPVDQGGAIDAAAFVDADGARYVTWKNDGNAIGLPTRLYVQRVEDDGVTPIGAPITALENDPELEGGLIEAPYLVRHHDRYYLFYSYGEWWNETYTTGYATAPRLAGPWVRSTTPLLTTEIMKGTMIGPGGASFPGDLIVAHGVRNNPDFYRAAYVIKLGWRGSTPVVRVR